MNAINPIRSTARIALRSYATHPSASLNNPYIIYANPRRFRAAGITLLAVGQAGFWGMATTLAHQVPEPLISSGWTVAGVGLSAAFAAMVNAYLRRNIAEIALLNGAAIRVTAHSFGGMLSTPVIYTPQTIVRGPKGDDPSERYWTFGVKTSSRRPFYYFIDTNCGLVDRQAVAALVNGGEHLMAFSHKRDAQIMTSRWQQWQQTSGKSV